jgi:hypothetical protein
VVFSTCPKVSPCHINRTQRVLLKLTLDVENTKGSPERESHVHSNAQYPTKHTLTWCQLQKLSLPRTSPHSISRTALWQKMVMNGEFGKRSALPSFSKPSGEFLLRVPDSGSPLARKSQKLVFTSHARYFIAAKHLQTGRSFPFVDWLSAVS